MNVTIKDFKESFDNKQDCGAGLDWRFKVMNKHEVPDWMIDESNKMRADNAQLQYALEQSENIVGDLTYLVKQLVHSIKNERADKVLSERAMNYLKRKEL